MKTKEQLTAECWATLNQNDGCFLVFLYEKKPQKNKPQNLGCCLLSNQDEIYPNSDSIPL